MDVISLCSALIKCKSITPADDGAQGLIAQFLAAAGFEITELTFRSPDGANEIKNLFAQYGASGGKSLGFLGHSDVVPAGESWESDPFSPLQKDGYLVGRGVSDMKGGIAAFCCAAAQFVREKFDGSICFLITGDEEVGSREGAQSLLKWCSDAGRLPRDFIIGEPASHSKLGDNVYLGHRGSLNVVVESIGLQGHSAYPANFKNSLAAVCQYVAHMLNYQWKYEDLRFPCTHLEPTLLFTNNYATNVVPDRTSANLNIRFGADYSSRTIEEVMTTEARGYGLTLDFHRSGEPFYCDPKELKGIFAACIKDVVKVTPKFSAAGGTSDGRFIPSTCNIIEFGLLDDCLHQKNEKAKLDDIRNLEKIYLEFLKRY
ncbi:MAG: succinyl-diaminopimelate desuccinylase [Holosporaceae bacterium]|jgi:succinyl-diaminopimelate desuccinylase|nr:succinyl-diaminopimelate desuccinylase [Holosporaceae bacterium]